MNDRMRAIAERAVEEQILQIPIDAQINGIHVRLDRDSGWRICQVFFTYLNRTLVLTVRFGDGIHTSLTTAAGLPVSLPLVLGEGDEEEEVDLRTTAFEVRP